MNDQLCIGITGRYGSGKSTLAAILREMVPGSEVVAFADALKCDVLQTVNRALGTDYTREDLERDKATVWGPILQGWGELCRRTYGEDYWIDRLADVLPRRAIIADVRYENEAAFVKCQPTGLIVFVDGPNRRGHDARSATHPSEAKAGEPWGDVVVTNTSTLQFLRDQARCIARMADNLARTSHMAGVS